MARLLLIVLVLTLLPDGMAYNPQQCTACPVVENTRTSTKTQVVTPDAPEPEPEWECPPIDDCTEEEYMDLCKEACHAPECRQWRQTCEKCWKESE